MVLEKQVNNRIGQWLGPFVVEGVDEQRELLLVGDQPWNPARPFNVSEVKPYRTPEQLSQAFIVDLDNCLAQFRWPHICDIMATDIIDEHDERATSHEMREARKKEIYIC